MNSNHRSMSLGEGNKSLSHSRRSTFRRCRRLYWLQYVQGISPKELSAPLRMGGIYSDGLEAANPEVVQVKYNDLITEAIGNDQYFFADKLMDELAIVKPMVQTYLEHVAVPRHDREIEFVGVEELGYQDNGRIDGLLKTDHGILLIENKLKSRWGRAEEKSLQFDDQLTSYFVNIQMLMQMDAGKIKARYEVAKKPQLRQHKTETRDAFRSRVSADILSRPDHYHVVIGDIVRNQEQLDEWKILFSRMARDIESEHKIEESGDKGAWPKNPDSCSDYGGCEMIPLCWAKDEESMNVSLQTDFTIREV